jgi:hypothetical protein
MKIKKIKKQSVIGAQMQARSAAIAGNTPAINMAKMLAASGLVRRVRVDEIVRLNCGESGGIWER